MGQVQERSAPDVLTPEGSFVRALTACRMCGKDELFPFLDLGYTPLADEFRSADELRSPQAHYPLVVLMCEVCGLAQLSVAVAKEIMFPANYPYEASATAAGRAHFAELAATVVAMHGLGLETLAVDVGSNVGVLVGQFAANGVRAVGVEPTAAVAAIARASGLETIEAFFDTATARRIVEEHGPADIVTATNVFAHLDDLEEFIRALDVMLAPDGVLVIEAPSFAHLIGKLEYDTIYHEHVSYVSVTPVKRFFATYGFELFDVREVGIHGGSLRLFVGRSRMHPVNDTVEATIAQERAAGVHAPATLERFAADVRDHRDELRRLVQSLRQQGARIAGVSAPAKGMTLLSYCGFNRCDIELLTEKSTLKIGRFSPGAGIPVVPDDALDAKTIQYGLLLAWNFEAEIRRNLTSFSAAGGRFIIPIPRPRIV